MAERISDARKAKEIQAFFQQHGRIHIMVDATADDVVLPEHLRGDPAVPIVLNVRMPQPIYIRPEGVESEFSFGGVPYPCRIPLHRIWAMYVPGRERETAVVWEESIPEMLRAAAETIRASTGAPAPQAAETNEPLPHDSDEPPSAPKRKGRKARHLRVVK